MRFTYPPYAHFRLPGVRGLLENVRRELAEAAPLEGEKLPWLLWGVLEAVRPAPRLPPLSLLLEAIALAEEDLKTYNHLPMAVRLWYASVLPYRFASPEELDPRGRWAVWYRPLRLLRSDYRLMLRRVDDLVVRGAFLMSADARLSQEFEALKTFHFLALAQEEKPPLPTGD